MINNMDDYVLLDLFYFVDNTPIACAQFKKSLVLSTERKRSYFIKMLNKPCEAFFYSARYWSVETFNITLGDIGNLKTPWAHFFNFK
ncbi:MAG: hypothetical protein Q7S26_03180 [bacterium]|nr:hypothetical protein [bacterium]